MRFKYFILIVFAVFSHCTPQRQDAKKTMARRTALLPNLRLHENDPLNEWLLELTQPSLLDEPSLNWSCNTTLKVLMAEWSQAQTTCPQLQSNNARLLKTKICTGNKSVEIKNSTCDLQESLQTLYSLRLNSKDALLHEKERGVFTPSSKFAGQLSAPSTLRLQESAPYNLVEPTLQEWLRTSSERGALKLNLSLPKESQNALAFDTLHYLSAQSSSKLFQVDRRFFQELLSGRPTETEKKRKLIKTLGRPILKAQHSNPLYQKACEYLQTWMLSRIALTTEYELSKKTFELECFFRWGPNPAQEHTLLWLALPLKTLTTHAFPFYTKDNAVDPRILSGVGDF